MYNQVHGSPTTGISPLVEGWAPIRSIQAIERLVLWLSRAYQDRQQKRLAIRDLRRLNDHILRDLGIERSRIPEVAGAQVAARRHQQG